MPLTLDDFRAAMTSSAGKVVTFSDVKKKAYVPTAEQRSVLSIAGYEPVSHTQEREFSIIIAGTARSLRSSYYPSERVGSGRRPEIRMGREIINWVSEGEILWLGTDGEKMFAYKQSGGALATSGTSRSSVQKSDNDAEDEIDAEKAQLHRDLGDQRILARARAAVGGGSLDVASRVYERHPAIREFARRRSQCRCERPGCEYVPFEKRGGGLFIEVHHIHALSEVGEDVIENVAAVCPNCHRLAHHGVNREAVNKKLLEAVAVANKAYLKRIRAK